jgi:O-antigen ligase/Flp pilus assembly protein TadD
MSRAGRLLLLAHLVLAPLLFHTGCYGVFEYPKFALLLLVSVLLGALGMCRLVRNGPTELSAILKLIRHDPLALGVVLFLLSAVLSTLASISMRTSLFGAQDSHGGLCTIACYTVLFITTRAVCRTSGDARLLLAGCVLAGVITALYALMQFARLDPLTWTGVSDIGSYVRPFGTLGHPNFLAAYLVMALPLALLFTPGGAPGARALRHVAFALLLVLPPIVILLTLSRGAWIALLSVAVVLLFGFWRLRMAKRATLVTLVTGLLAFLTVAGLCVFNVNQLGSTLSERLEQFAMGASRGHIWQAGLELFADRPLVGLGPDTFQLAFGLKRPEAFWLSEWGATPARAHNELIHILATQGLFGAVALAIILAGLVLACVRAWRRTSSDDRLLVLALGAGVLGFVVTSAFSYTVVACGTIFVTMAALLSRLADATTEIGSAANVTTAAPNRGWLQTIVWAGAAVCIFWVVVRPYQAHCLVADSEQALHKHPARAVELLTRAVALLPGNSDFQTKLGGALQLAAAGALTSTGRDVLLARAADALRQACDLEPHSAYCQANLGRFLAKQKVSTEAHAAFDRALSLDPNNAHILSDAADAALDLGDAERGAGFAQRCRALYPHFALPYAQLGHAALLRGRHAEAIELFNHALRTREWYADEEARLRAWCHLMSAYLQTRAYEQAAAVGRLILRHAPDLAEVRRRLAFALDKVREKQDAKPTASIP